MKDYPKGVKVVYDAGENEFDRYTVYYWKRFMSATTGHYAYLAASSDPCSPCGLGQHGEGKLGRHNGKQISFSELPDAVRELVKRDLSL